MHTSLLAPSVYQRRVVVVGISPLTWRRLLIRSDVSLRSVPHQSTTITLRFPPAA